MTNTLKIIQIILFSLIIFPSLFFLIKEPFNKLKKYRKNRILFFGALFLINSLIFVILSIIISYNDELYLAVKYAPFIQSWIIIKSTLIVYIELFLITLVSIGLYGFYLLVTNRHAQLTKYAFANYNFPKKLSLRQKIEYPYIYYEIYVDVKLFKNDSYLVTGKALKEILEFMATEM